MNSITDEIKSKINIVDLVNEYVRLQKAGANWKACCPFHNEKTPSFIVNEEKQFWHCFGCGKGGDIFTFLMEIEGFQFREALENLAEKTGVKIESYKNTKEPNAKDDILKILELSTKFYEKQLWSPVGKEALNYLKRRGLKEETIREFRIGYAPSGWSNILDFLVKQKFFREKILKSGIVVEKENKGSFYDRFRNRIIFPISDISGRVVGYSARIVPGDNETQAKYINTPETEVYHKSNILYGMHKAKTEIRNKDEVLLVEGNMDVIASYQAGIKNVVAVSGTALTTEQLKLIKRYTNNIKMFFDMDDAGQMASKKSSKLAFKEDMNVFIVKVSGAKDAAEIVVSNLNEFLLEIQNALPAMEYFLEQMLKKNNKDNIIAKKNIIFDLGELVNSFLNEIEREYWIKNIAEKLDISEEVLFKTFDKQRNQNNFNRTEVASDQKYENFVIQDRAKNIQLEIMGLLLANSHIWKDFTRKKKKEMEKLFSSEKIVKVIKLGEQVNFDFEKLLEILEDERQKKFLRELFLESLERNKHDSTEDKKAELDRYIAELEKEKRREKLKKIIKKIKTAEKNGDKKSIKKLMQRLTKFQNS